MGGCQAPKLHFGSTFTLKFWHHSPSPGLIVTMIYGWLSRDRGNTVFASFTHASRHLWVNTLHNYCHFPSQIFRLGWWGLHFSFRFTVPCPHHYCEHLLAVSEKKVSQLFLFWNYYQREIVSQKTKAACQET